MTRKRKYPKMRGKARELASKYIAEEVRAGKENPVAVGISRAREAVKKSRRDAEICDIMRRYR